MTTGSELIDFLSAKHDPDGFRELNWRGTFEQYLDIARKDPRVTRSAFERVYDMILAKGTSEYEDHKKKVVHYNFFDDPDGGGRDAVYGLDIPLMKLVNIFKSAAQRYGTEKRVLLLHGPVGSAKSTIVRLLKKGLEEYSRTPQGALYTFAWRLDGDMLSQPNADVEEVRCPMHEDPLHLIPESLRAGALEALHQKDSPALRIEGDLCPACRQNYRELDLRYSGDWKKIMSNIVVSRLVLSEKVRVGIGKFQP